MINKECLMKIILLNVTALMVLTACATKVIPTIDISNAKMALIKVETSDAKKYVPKELAKIKTKYQKLQSLIQEEAYDAGKFLAQEIQADARVLEKKVLKVQRENEVKKLQGEINTLKKDFTHVVD